MVRTNSIQHRGPAQIHVTDNDVILLRQVDFKRLGPGLTDMLRNTHITPGTPEGDMPWFMEGYIAVDQPRDINMSMAILEATLGFAIARVDTGEVLAQFERNQFERATKVASNSKASYAVGLQMEDEPEADE